MCSTDSSREEGLGGIEIIQDPVEIQKLAFSLIQTAIEEILVMYSTANAFHRQERKNSVIKGSSNGMRSKG
jgi:hypothetical protein